MVDFLHRNGIAYWAKRSTEIEQKLKEMFLRHVVVVAVVGTIGDLTI